MVSYAGEAAVSGVSLVNMFNTVFIFLFSALAAGGAVVVSQYIGSRDRKKRESGGGTACDDRGGFLCGGNDRLSDTEPAASEASVRRGGPGCDGGVCDLSSDLRLIPTRQSPFTTPGRPFTEYGKKQM